MKIEICRIIAKLFILSIDDVINNSEKSLLTHPFNLRPTELLYLYFYLEKKYDVTFDERDVLDYSFISVESICTILNKSIQ